jgi:hypothetical protein
MLTVYVRNIKTVKDIADYEYIVMVNAEKIAEGKVLKHKRSDGWVPLIRGIVEQNEKNEEKKGYENAALRCELKRTKLHLDRLSQEIGKRIDTFSGVPKTGTNVLNIETIYPPIVKGK